MDSSIRATCIRLMPALAALTLAGLPARLQAQRLLVEVRGGVIASTSLAQDEVVRREVLDTLVPGARGAPLEAEPVSATPGLAPLLVLAARTQVAPALGVEAAAGWTFAQLRAREGSTDRDVQDLGVVHAVLGLRYHLHPRIYLRGGLGGIRYLAEREGLFREGSEVKAVLEVAGGARWRVAGLRLAVEAMAQAHSFGTVAQRRARGLDGTVYRGAVQVGVAFGGDWP